MKASYRIEEVYWGNEWACNFFVDGRSNCDERGTNGTGCKIYPTKEKAEDAGKRYLKKMQKNGFEI